MADQKPQDEKLGALWIKQSARGEFMTGNIEIDGKKIAVVCFKNDRKTGNQPDWRVLKSKPAQNRADGKAPVQSGEMEW